MKTVEQSTTVGVDRLVSLETTPEGGLLALFRRAPVKFETIFDDKDMSYTFKCTWEK